MCLHLTANVCPAVATSKTGTNGLEGDGAGRPVVAALTSQGSGLPVDVRCTASVVCGMENTALARSVTPIKENIIFCV